MGPGQSHNTIILDLYFKDYSLSDIERQTNHSETSGRPYLSDFIQIASLHRQGFTPTQIRRITQKSDRLVREYLEFYTTCDRQDNERLHQQQLMPQSSGEAAKKRRLAPVPGGHSHEQVPDQSPDPVEEVPTPQKARGCIVSSCTTSSTLRLRQGRGHHPSHHRRYPTTRRRLTTSSCPPSMTVCTICTMVRSFGRPTQERPQEVRVYPGFSTPKPEYMTRP